MKDQKMLRGKKVIKKKKRIEKVGHQEPQAF
jgi:hypothetical protein